ncbi:MAG: Gfo/Idh/MocA family oxidoreductase [Lachnospiraceae bacterium]|nr:Gfo/Idh/MocA family oxidoreductase [Lachnospiraceae bacterium]
MTRWAIIGTGYIANRFASGMTQVKDAKGIAVVSRNLETAHAFAEKYGIQSCFDEFTTMLQVAKPDIVYVAVPNDCHMEYIEAALEAGVHVLSEKPMTDTVAQMEQVFAKAKEKNLFVMEGMWTRCFPAVRQARQWLEEGCLGEVLAVHASFDIKPAMEEWQPWKGGAKHAAGALRDVGIYSLAMAYLAFPQGPQEVHCKMVKNEEVDVSVDMMLDYETGAAHISGAFNRVSQHQAVIIGEKGKIIIGPEFWCPSKAVLQFQDGTEKIFEESYEASGFQYEITRVQEMLEQGKLQCDDFTWEESRAIGTIIERLRKENNILYAADEQ